MRLVLVRFFLAAACSCSLVPSASAADCGDGTPVCSYSATNKSCTVTIDRLNPVTPPTIYVQRGCVVKVAVVNPSPLEDLTLDWKTSALVIPPDTFQAAFSALSTNLGKVTVISAIHKIPDVGMLPLEKYDLKLCMEGAGNCDDPEVISRKQKQVETELDAIKPLDDASHALKQIQIALQPIPLANAGYVTPWRNEDCPIKDGWPIHTTGFQCWQGKVAKELGTALHADEIKDKEKTVMSLQKEVAEYKRVHRDPAGLADGAELDANQTKLSTTLANLKGTTAKLLLLRDAVDSTPLTGPDVIGTATITDTTDKAIRDKSYFKIETWTIDYANRLAPAAKRVAADSVKSGNAATLAGLADAPAKMPLITLTVQFQSPSRIEVSSGLLVPLLPYHSYSKASQATGGTVIDNVVQETKSFTVVPMAFVNFLLKEGTVKRQRSAIFFSGGVGYNPATSAVEFGAGFTYAYRSIEASGMADIGRDTKLAGGFTVGQFLGNTSAAATPLTSGYWTVKPAAAISVRIPLGSAGK